jgi:uncharacterized protein
VIRFLLDVNVLIALIDPAHVLHDRAHAWFAANGHKAWATCPLTENGVMRIVGHPRYPNSPGSPATVAELLTSFRKLSGHVFWSDDISLLDYEQLDTTHLLDSSHVTDSYLLALAHAHEGQLATFDQHMPAGAVVDGSKVLHVIQ